MSLNYQNPIVRRTMIGLGCLCVLLGVIGLIVPMMPGALFLFCAAWLFARSSERFHEWLMTHKQLGPIVKAFETGEGFDRPLRRRILTVLWLSLIISMFLIGKWWSILVVGGCGVGVTWYLMQKPLWEDVLAERAKRQECIDGH